MKPAQIKLLIWFVIFVLFFLAVGVVIKFRGEAVGFAITNPTQVLQAKKTYDRLSNYRDEKFKERLNGRSDILQVIDENVTLEGK